MKTQSYRVTDGLYLVEVQLAGQAKPAPAEPTPVNHVLVVDCSGSMAGDLPRMREQLKQRIPKLLGERDTLSIVWFSGRGECGVLVNQEPVATLRDLQDVNKAIDRWLKPVGMTGFREPLDEVTKLVAGAKNKNPWSLFFMSDGCDNQWPRADILAAVKRAGATVAAATFVEYGYYADRALLSKMAETAGGAHIFSQDFASYAPALEGVLQRKVTTATRVAVPVQGDPVGGFVFRADGGELFAFEVAGGQASVPEDAPTVWYLSPAQVGAGAGSVDGRANHQSTDHAYAALSLFSVRMQPQVVLPLLKALGDVDFIEQFSTCFGKQAYSAFMDRAKEAAFGKARLAKGYDPARVPPDDAFTVMDLLQLLAEDEDNHVLLDHDEFEYSRISRATVEEPGALKFKADRAPRGYPVTSLTFNETRPNVSLLVRIEGHVDLGDRPAAAKKVPKRFATQLWRNYAVVRDGLVNVKKLPVNVTQATWAKLRGAGMVSGPRRAEAVLDLSALPILNRRAVAAVSAREFFGRELELCRQRARQKVFGAALDQEFPGAAQEGFEAQYGKEAAEWLREQGLTPRGFSPKSKAAPATDFYRGKELEARLKGLSSLPKVADVQKRVEDGKPFTAAMKLMAPAMGELAAFRNDDACAKAADPAKLLRQWLVDKKAEAARKVRGLLMEQARARTAVIVGQVWFSEFATINDNTMVLHDPELGDVACEAELREVEIKL